MKFAVVVAATSRREHLARCLAALDHQTVSGDLYLVDNSGGPLFTTCQSLAPKMAKWETEVIVLAARWARVGVAYNIGLLTAMADGMDYIIKLDDDVLLPPGAIEAMISHPGVFAIPPDGAGYMASEIRGSVLETPVGNFPKLYGACFGMLRGVVSHLGFFNERWNRGIDLEWGMRAYLADYSVAYHPEINAMHLGDVPSEGGIKLKYMQPPIPHDVLPAIHQWTIWENSSLWEVGTIKV